MGEEGTEPFGPVPVSPRSALAKRPRLLPPGRRALAGGAGALYIAGMALTLSPFRRRRPLVAVLRLSGAIGMGRGGLSDAALAPVIERAFARGRPAAVALTVNSPGGSAVQSSLIAARIRRLAEQKRLPVHAFVEDAAASGGYWLASAADRIWADESSLLGSIGVIHASFGFPEFLARHGVERRVITAGRSKSLADPFRPMGEEDEARLRRIMTPIHAAFIEQVRARRPGLTGEDLFTGEVWAGREAVERGLADGIAHLVPKMQEILGKRVRFRVHGPRRPFLSRFGLSAMEGLSAAMEERALWARYGL